MRKVVLLLFVGGLALVAIQDESPIVLVFFGSQTIALPVAIWILCAIAAGFLTSLLLQLLNYRPLSTVQPTPPLESRRRRERVSRATRANSPPASDWETTTQVGDWGDRATSVRPPTPKRRLDKEPQSEKTQQQPTGKSRSRGENPEQKIDREPPPSASSGDRVYDADYRVIATPYQREDSSSEEEDWGFDDEEFESEYRRNYRDRLSDP